MDFDFDDLPIFADADAIGRFEAGLIDGTAVIEADEDGEGWTVSRIVLAGHLAAARPAHQWKPALRSLPKDHPLFGLIVAALRRTADEVICRRLMDEGRIPSFVQPYAAERITAEVAL